MNKTIILSLGLIILPTLTFGSKPDSKMSSPSFRSIAVDGKDLDISQLSLHELSISPRKSNPDTVQALWSPSPIVLRTPTLGNGLEGNSNYNGAYSNSASPRIPSVGAVQLGRFSVSYGYEVPETGIPVQLRTPTPQTPRGASPVYEYVDAKPLDNEDRVSKEHESFMEKVVEEAFDALEKHRDLANAIFDRNRATGVVASPRDEAIYQQVEHSVKALQAYETQNTRVLEGLLSSGAMSRDQQIHTFTLYADLLDSEEKAFAEKGTIKILPMSVVRESPSYKSRCSTPGDGRSSSASSGSYRDQSPISAVSNSGRYSVFSPIQSAMPPIAETKRKGSMNNEASLSSASVPSGRTPNSLDEK